MIIKRTNRHSSFTIQPSLEHGQSKPSYGIHSTLFLYIFARHI